MDSARTRVVITGRGVISSIGHDVKTFWNNLLSGHSGVARVTLFDPSDFPTQIAAEVKEWNPAKWMPAKEARRMARCSQFALAAAIQAMDDARLSDSKLDEGVGIFLGTGIGGFEQGHNGIKALHLSKRGWRAISPFSLPAALPNMPAYHIAVAFGIKGHMSTLSAACATGTQVIFEAAEVIRRGWAHTIVTGATEAVIDEAVFGGYCQMRGMSTRNDQPTAAVRPFDRERNGFLIGEGAAIFVLESLEHALARKAHIYAEVMGGASTSDAFHMAQPQEEGNGMVRAIKLASQYSGVPLNQINYINPHGPGTPLGDKIEVLAMKTAFGDAIYNIAISSTKSMIAHTMGAAGALESLATLLTLETQMIHPTLNCNNPEFDLDFVTSGVRQAKVDVAMSNNFGLGGQNASLILKRWHDG